MAALQFLMLLARPKVPDMPDLRRIAAQSIAALILTWLVIAVSCITFQCAVPHQWDQASGRCFNQVWPHGQALSDDENNGSQSAFWMTNGMIDVTTQLLMGLAPLYLLFDLHLPVAKKRLALLSFTPYITYGSPPNLIFRVLTWLRTIPLAVLRLVYLYRVYHPSNTANAALNVALVTVIHTNYSVVASCVPLLKPVLDYIAIDLVTKNVGVPARWEESAKDGSKTTSCANVSRGTRFQTRHAYGWSPFPTPSEYTFTVTGGKNTDLELQTLELYGSQDRMVINQTNTTVVSSDPRPPR